MTRVMQRVRAEPERLQVRELASVLEALASPGFGTCDGNDQNEPFAILSIGWRGEITTFSPELLGTAHPTYGSFTFGNVATHALAQVAADPCFQAIRDAIAGGVQACKQTCDYFPICLGGAPANKLGELGTSCRHSNDALPPDTADPDRRGPRRPRASRHFELRRSPRVGDGQSAHTLSDGRSAAIALA